MAVSFIEKAKSKRDVYFHLAISVSREFEEYYAFTHNLEKTAKNTSLTFDVA